MPRQSFEEVIPEPEFAGLLRKELSSFARLANTVASRPLAAWGKKHFNQVGIEADDLESFLDDYGARFNDTYGLFRELVASVRWFAMAGLSVGHLAGRIQSYGVSDSLEEGEFQAGSEAVARVMAFIHHSVCALLERTKAEAKEIGIGWPDAELGEQHLRAVAPRQRLPRNVGQEDLEDEDQRIAEVASKYLAACDLFTALGVQRIDDAGERTAFLRRVCSEEQARVYDATVHNLQSAYDTYIKNSVVESRDPRLARLRGHLSASLHLLQAVTYLTHFVERHESELRSESAETHIAQVIDRDAVQDVILNELLCWADRFLRSGRPIAEDLLPAYTNVQELKIELAPDLKLHARPASLIVGIVGKYGTPVELEVAGQTCSAGSILDVLVTIGSHPEARTFVFRGDSNPLRDIGLLFQAQLGERGIDKLPDALDYLRGDA